MSWIKSGGIMCSFNQISDKLSKFLVVALLLLTFLSFAHGQHDENKNSCKCLETFALTVSKIETNYLAYQIEVKNNPNTTLKYKHFVERLRTRAKSVSYKNCIFILQEYLKFFRDGHLFISENPTLNDEDLNRLTINTEKINLDEQDIRKYLEKNAKNLDPIEGIWYESEGYRVGIIRDVKRGRRDFVAIMLSDNVKNWLPGQVKAEFNKLSDGSYQVIFYNSRHFPLHLSSYQRGQEGGAAIRRGVILHLPPISWGKVYPLKKNEENQIDSINPRSPTVYFPDKSTIVFSIPSHSPEYAETLKKLVEKHRPEILQSQILIIDIRGNEGGSSWMTNPLLPFLETTEKKTRKYPKEESVVLSSTDNIKYFEQIAGDGWLPKKLIVRMKENIGKVIPFSDGNSETADNSKVETTNFPRNVGILMDRGVVSAGEAFVLEAMRNKKVTLFGENTGGVIDYQNVSVIQINDCSTLGFYLGYPMIATSGKLPKGGFNSKGIKPDIRIPRSIKNPV